LAHPDWSKEPALSLPKGAANYDVGLVAHTRRRPALTDTSPERSPCPELRSLPPPPLPVQRRHLPHRHTRYDLQGKRLLWSGEGRGKETLEAFFAEHGEALKGKLLGVCCDMWQPYIDVIRECCPKAILVFDKFHIIQKLLQAVDEVRRQEASMLKKANPELLKRTRYIWLKNPENLTPKQRARLGYLEKVNLRTNRAYLLKETFCELWTCKRRGWARRFLKRWFWWASHSRLKPMRDFAWMLRRHQDEILNYFHLRIDNGAVEGLNNKAKVVSHRCYGFRTATTFITALYHCLGNLPEPRLVHRFL